MYWALKLSPAMPQAFHAGWAISGWMRWVGVLYLKAKRSAEPGSVGGGGRRLSVVRPQPKRITRVQDDLQRSQPGHRHNSILPLHPRLQQPNGKIMGTPSDFA